MAKYQFQELAVFILNVSISFLLGVFVTSIFIAKQQ